MTSTWRTRRAVVLIATLTSLVALVAVLLYPKPVSRPALGRGWQCGATAFSTSCTRIHYAEPTMSGFRRAPVRLWDVSLRTRTSNDDANPRFARRERGRR
jgi:hypothetical protein